MDDTLANFLLARIAEDEAVAKAATLGPWFAEDPSWSGFFHDGTTSLGTTYPDESMDNRHGANAEHIVRHDPARVLAECEAKRAIIADELAEWEDVLGDSTDHAPNLFKHLVQPYADHPDYREEWTL